jgi:hypothetical protein
MLPTHSLLTFIPAKSGQKALVHIKKEVDDDTYNLLVDFFDENFKRNGKASQWVIKASEAKDLCLEVEKILDEEESDDELIQEALARRFKSQSSGKHIDKETVDDSEDEDVISLSRRLRHIYTMLDKINKTQDEILKKLNQ